MKLTLTTLVKNIEKSLDDYLKEGYQLLSLERKCDEEVRFYLQKPKTDETICLVRDFWNELNPDFAFQSDEPRTFIEFRTNSKKEFMEKYLLLKSIGLVKPIPNDNLKGVPIIPIKMTDLLLLVSPTGYTWSDVEPFEIG